MKKFLMSVLVIALLAPLAFFFVACGRDNNENNRRGPRDGFYTVSQKFQDLRNELIEFAMEMVTGQFSEEGIAEWAEEEVEWLQIDMGGYGLDYESVVEIRVFFAINPWLEFSWPGISDVVNNPGLTTADMIWDAVEEYFVDFFTEMSAALVGLVDLMLEFTPEESILIFGNEMFVMFEGFLPILAASLFNFSSEVAAWRTPAVGHLGIQMSTTQYLQYLNDLDNLFASMPLIDDGYVIPLISLEYWGGGTMVDVRIRFFDINLREYSGAFWHMYDVIDYFDDLIWNGLLMPTASVFDAHVSRGTIGDSWGAGMPDLEQLEAVMNMIAMFDVLGVFVRLGFTYSNGQITLNMSQDMDLEEILEDVLGLDLSELPFDIFAMLGVLDLDLTDLFRISYRNGLISFQLYIPQLAVALLTGMQFAPAQLLEMAYEFTGINLSSLLTTTSNGGNLITFAQFQRAA